MPYARSGVATEYRPGTYVFGDRQQLTLGSVSSNQLSLTVVATVIAVHGERVVVDAGGKALGRDAPRWLEGYGLLANGSETLIDRLYDHHSVIDSYRGNRLRVGDRVAVVPNNANSTMALLRSVWITEDGESAAGAEASCRTAVAACRMLWRARSRTSGRRSSACRLSRPDHDFFELGGTSFHAARVVTKTRAAFGVKLSAQMLFEHSTLAGFAAEVGSAQASEARA